MAMAGMANRLSRCTPMDNPIRYAIKMIHFVESGRSATFSHLRMAQNTSAVNKLDNA